MMQSRRREKLDPPVEPEGDGGVQNSRNDTVVLRLDRSTQLEDAQGHARSRAPSSMRQASDMRRQAARSTSVSSA